MRRKDKEIISIEDKISIIDKCKVCRLGLSENNKPYVIPLNYGYSFGNNMLTLFFHGAKEGRKNEIIKTNNSACFEIDCGGSLIEAEKACKHGYAFKSVIGFGEIVIVEARDEKNEALNHIMKHQTGKAAIYNFTAEELDNVLVYKMNVMEFTGKQKLFPGEKAE
jgi:nitroimidazol reductase NimA-like FMN-containing flavoprotein (pyridoxamine 5'-phosphate oxidase superfamily)